MSADMSRERPIPGATERTARGYQPLLVVAVVLLAFILAINAFQAVGTYRQNRLQADRAATYQQRVKAAEDIVQKQQDFITGLMDQYKKDAYNNSDVDRIAEQQLLAAEYTLETLQVIAVQNTQVIELLASQP